MKKLIYLIVLTLILGLVLTGCLLSNVGQVPTTEQSGIAYLTKNGSLPNLVGLWHFDEGSGPTAGDSSVNTNHGNIYDANWVVDGKFGNALSFDGNGDYVEFGSVVTGLIGGDYTVEAWIKPASLDPGRHAVMSFSYMELGYDAGKVYFWQAYDNSWNNGYQYMSPTVLLDVNEFSHIVGVFHEDAGVDLYVDGNYIGSGTTRTGTSVNIFGNTYAGVWYTAAAGGWFDGIIDEVRIWGGALTATQIWQSYEALHVDDDWAQWPGAYRTITEALAVAGSGDTIIVHEGTYNETVTIQSDDYDLTLEGKGAIIENDGTLMSGIILQGGTHHISISGFEIRGFTAFDGAGIEGWTRVEDGDFAPISHITIHHNNIHDNYDGINIGAWNPPWRHNNITIQHNVVEDNHYRGINLWAVSDSTLAHNDILNNGGDWNGNGVFDELNDDMNSNGVTDGDGMTWVFVSDSTATHNTINGSSEVGLSMNQSTGNTVTHNDVTDNDNLGIALFGWGAPTTANQFVRNDARGNASWDILCYTKWGSLVYGNKWVKNQYINASPDPPL